MTTAPTSGEPMERAAARLRTAGMRVTAPRMAMLTAISESPGHLDADTLRERAQRITGRLSLQATYNVLRALTDAGLVRSTQIPGRPALYETERHDHHHHFVCRDCGDIRDVKCTVGAAPCMEPQLPQEYHIQEAAVTFRGRVPRLPARGAGVLTAPDACTDLTPGPGSRRSSASRRPPSAATGGCCPLGH